MCRLDPCSDACDCEQGESRAANPLIAAKSNRIVLAILPCITDMANKSVDGPECDHISDELTRWPSSAEVVQELKQMSRIAGPMVFMGLLLYARAMISMLFLGHLGDTELAGGSLSIGFANITGYSVLAGLAMGMEPICGQACGAKRWRLMGITLQRTILVLLCACVPISILWINMRRILLWCGQDAGITSVAGTYILFSLPDLLAQAVLNPLRIYLRTQNITTPLTWCAALALSLHIPINFLLVVHFRMNVRGVALSAALTDLNLVLFLIAYLKLSGTYKRSWDGWSRECLKDWKPLLTLAIPSCISVCLEWWWYEFMIILSGLLIDAKAAVASMGILIQTTSLVYIFPSSLSLAVSTRVGNELGANRPDRARIATIVALGCAAVVGVVAMTFTTTVRNVWGGMFTTDASILHLTSVALPIVGICELGNCPQTTGCGVLRGCARPSTGANINLGSFYFVGMPVAMALGFLFDVGFPGLWLGLLAAQGTCAGVMMIVLMRTDWAVQAERAKQLTGGSVDGPESEKAAASVGELDSEQLGNGSSGMDVKSTCPRNILVEETESLISIKVVHEYEEEEEEESSHAEESESDHAPQQCRQLEHHEQHYWQHQHHQQEQVQQDVQHQRHDTSSATAKVNNIMGRCDCG